MGIFIPFRHQLRKRLVSRNGELSDPHPSDAVLADYSARRLPPSEVLTVSDHVAGCAVCRETLARLRPGTAVRAADFLPDPDGAADEGPGYEEMAALLDGDLTPEQAREVRERLAASPRAAAEFADLRAFADAAAGGTVAPFTRGKIVAFPGWAKLALAAAAVVLLNAGWWHFAPKPDPGEASLLAGANLADLPVGLRQSVERAARTGRVDAPALPPELRPKAGTLAGDAPAPAVLKQVSPVGTLVRETRPRLRWQGCPGATGYVVYLAATDSADAPLRQELPANRTDWPPPAALTRGAVYEWQVEARRGDEVIDRAPRPPAPEGRFEVLDAARAAELENVERSARGNALVLGTAYLRAGLREAAAEQFHELSRQYPKSAVADRLRRVAEAPAATP